MHGADGVNNVFRYAVYRNYFNWKYESFQRYKESFGDQAHILYVNASIQDDTRLGRLMHDLQCKEADQMYSKILAEQVRKLKETPEGVSEMCEIMDRIYQEGREEAQIEIAWELRAEGFPAERIAKILKTNVKTIEQWLAGERLIAR